MEKVMIKNEEKDEWKKMTRERWKRNEGEDISEKYMDGEEEDRERK